MPSSTYSLIASQVPQLGVIRKLHALTQNLSSRRLWHVVSLFYRTHVRGHRNPLPKAPAHINTYRIHQEACTHVQFLRIRAHCSNVAVTQRNELCLVYRPNIRPPGTSTKPADFGLHQPDRSSQIKLLCSSNGGGDDALQLLQNIKCIRSSARCVHASAGDACALGILCAIHVEMQARTMRTRSIRVLCYICTHTHPINVP